MKKFKSLSTIIDKHPELKSLEETKKELKQEISSVEESIRNAKTVLKYQEKNEAATLNNLILKWRRASQEAAEFLFSKFQEAQNSSFSSQGNFYSSNNWGGSSKNWGWDENHYSNGSSENRKDQEDDENEDDEEQQSDSDNNSGTLGITMKSMLTQFGIDLGLIKWDEDQESFLD
ncbi:3325_t:CDS:2 [Ambispora leptoticha]|uniref:Swi5-dependent recombination DNA repair protein 1 homolog n=1 Tax=Ambispora leptoticha TaxID=144679 RepID=A0A9N9GAG3_9GLOM|nr:3325_t:CDS:2 [Ambispora leptoticha]